MKKILVVDDSESIRTSLKFSFSQRGYNILLAENGKEAMTQLKTDPDIGLLITDMQMPVMDGAALIKAVRAEAQLFKLPIIVLTSEDGMGEQAISLGATGFVMKSSKTSEEIHHFVKTYIKL
jgi:CheY-like chemotaxis protein